MKNLYDKTQTETTKFVIKITSFFLNDKTTKKTVMNHFSEYMNKLMIVQEKKFWSC